jgi:hypothetical protein
MFDPRLTASTISRDWTGKLSADLAAAIKVFDESEWAQPPAAAFTTEGITAENVATRIEEHARELAAAEVFAKAKTAARDALGLKVIAAATAAAPDMLEQLRPQFDKAAQDYTAAVAKLPERITGDAIAVASPETQQAYREAVDAAKVIRGIDGWLADLTGLPQVGSTQYDKHCRVLSPKDRKELAALMSVSTKQPAEVNLDPVLLCAARNGITFEAKTPAEATALRKAIDASPTTKTNDGPKGRW